MHSLVAQRSGPRVRIILRSLRRCGTLLLGAHLLAACGDGSRPSDVPTSPARPDLDRSVSLARTRSGQGPPANGGSILVPPSPDTYVFQFPAAPSPSLLATLEATYGLVLDQQEPAGSETIALFHGPVGLDLGEILFELGDEITDASTNESVQLVEDASLTGGFVVGEWTPDSLATTSGLEMLDLSFVHFYATGSGSRIAILDTGLDLNHPLFAGHVEPLPAEATLISSELLDGVDDDHDGEIDEAYGHGTHVAGIIAQVAPEAILIPIRVLNADGVGSLWDLMSGLNLALQQGAQIINLSIAVNQANDLMEAFLGKYEAEGFKTVAAGGNSGFNAPTYPGTSPHTLGVAAVDEEGVMANFSGGGSTIAVAAPGVSILSAFPDLRMARASGTSMATAAVSGSLALLRDGMGLGPIAAAVRLCETASPITPAGGVTSGVEFPIAALGITRD